MRTVVTADEFLTSPNMDRVKRDVPVPELGEGKVIPIWGMTPKERSTWEDAQSRLPKAQQATRKLEVRERILVECSRNDDGSKIFTNAQITALGQRRGDVVERLVDVALELSGFTSQDVEAIVKNSEKATEE